MNTNSRMKAGHRQHTGFAMLEALVALLICAMGVLGVVGLQGAMTRAQTAATFRAEAAFLAQQLLGEMWADRSNLAAYDSRSCGTSCQDWQARVAARLPNGQSTVTVTPATGAVSIDIRWAMAGESANRFTMGSSIN